MKFLLYLSHVMIHLVNHHSKARNQAKLKSILFIEATIMRFVSGKPKRKQAIAIKKSVGQEADLESSGYTKVANPARSPYLVLHPRTKGRPPSPPDPLH